MHWASWDANTEWSHSILRRGDRDQRRTHHSARKRTQWSAETPRTLHRLNSETQAQFRRYTHQSQAAAAAATDFFKVFTEIYSNRTTSHARTPAHQAIALATAVTHMYSSGISKHKQGDAWQTFLLLLGDILLILQLWQAGRQKSEFVGE